MNTKKTWANVGTRGGRRSATIANWGVAQYVILGAGLDTFAERRPEAASRLRVFESDEPRTQAWKQQRLAAFGT